MREISEYTLLGNYLIFLGDKLGQDSIKFELAKSFTDKVLEIVNKFGQCYELLPIDSKMNIVKKMISKGVFRTDSSNPLKPFKQIYNYEVSKNIFAFYGCDGSLTFKFITQSDNNKDFLINTMKTTYSTNLNLDLRNSINSVLHEYEVKCKTKSK